MKYPDDYAKYKVGERVIYQKIRSRSWNYRNELNEGEIYTIKGIHQGTPNGIFYSVLNNEHNDTWYWEEDFSDLILKRNEKLKRLNEIS